MYLDKHVLLWDLTYNILKLLHFILKIPTFLYLAGLCGLFKQKMCEMV